MSLKSWIVKSVSRKFITKFIEENHYSGSINGCKSSYHYALFNEKHELKGAMFFGGLAMANQYKRFSDKEEDVIELRRLCCVNDTPKNTESFFIGKALKMLNREWGGKVVVSYADKEYGHVGTIYKASNFKMVGEVAGAKVIVYGDKLYHDKTIRTKYKDKLKPFAINLKKALDCGDAYYKTTAGKYTYVYNLKPITIQHPLVE